MQHVRLVVGESGKDGELPVDHEHAVPELVAEPLLAVGHAVEEVVSKNVNEGPTFAPWAAFLMEDGQAELAT